LGEELERIMLRLQQEGAESLSLVTPTPYVDQLLPILARVKPQLKIPVVYNCGGYESMETLARLEGLVDVYLPDCKYFSPELAALYSDAPDYFSVAADAIAEMLRQTGKPQTDGQGILRRGVVVRHLVLPGSRRDSEMLLEALHERFGKDAFLLSLMNQYTPSFAPTDAPKNLHRRVTSFEYSRVAETVERLGFSGYFQGRGASDEAYTPDFEGEGARSVMEKMTPRSCEKR
jgi:putative pyruvate formate lyase activating enzyme